MNWQPKILAVCLFTLSTGVYAQPQFTLTRIATPPQPGAIALYPEGEIQPATTAEQWGLLIGQINPDIRMEGRIARNVWLPTITPVLPPNGTANGAAVIVAPGGAFLSLSMDTEGLEVARRLAAEGITAFVLKYRLNPTPEDEAAFMQFMGQRMAATASGKAESEISEPRAAMDALQALRLVRQRAKEWQIDPARVGMIGFSAGAMAALQSVQTGKASDWPEFLGYIYGRMSAIEVPPEAPPMFVAIAMDDGLFARQGFGIVEAWRSAGRPVELHAYERGDHGFGTGRPGTTTILVIDEFIAWMQMHGWLVDARTSSAP